MTRRSQPVPPRTPGPLPVRRGPGRTRDPFIAFERAARDDGKPYKSPEPKAQRALLALLGTKAALVVMGGLVAVVVATLLVLLIVRA
jgi:hypothetical protein